MNKKKFQKKWYYKLLQISYFGSLILLSLFLIKVGIFDSDVEIAGLFWAGVLCLVYWLIKEVFYWIMFGEKIFGNNQKEVSIGFVSGVIIAIVGLVIIHKIYPNEDLAGIVMISLLVGGLIFSFIGCLIQKYFGKKAIKKRKKK